MYISYPLGLTELPKKKKKKSTLWEIFKVKSISFFFSLYYNIIESSIFYPYNVCKLVKSIVKCLKFCLYRHNITKSSPRISQVSQNYDF